MRSEIIHPMVSHFPIVLFSLYPFILGASFLVKNHDKGRWQELFHSCSKLLLYLGLLFHFISMYLGDMALDQISHSLCKLQLVYDHEHYAKLVLLSFLAVVGLDVYENIKLNLTPKPVKYFKLLVSIVGFFYIIQTGHSGATMVYEYGAGVNIPATCKKVSK